MSAGPCWSLNPSADQEGVDCNLKKEYVTCLLESIVEMEMNRKVFLPEKWTTTRHGNMGCCTFSVVPCPLAVCSFSLCCHLHSANTSACMPAWWVRSSWTDPAKKIFFFCFGHPMPAKSCPDYMTWVSELETGAQFVMQASQQLHQTWFLLCQACNGTFRVLFFIIGAI